MEITTTEVLNKEQKHEIIALWNNEYPKALMLSGLEDFDEYLASLSDKHHLLLIDKTGSVMGWLIYFIRDDERCFAMLLRASLQGKGYGSQLLDYAKSHNSALHGWVIDNDDQQKQNGTYYKSPIGFYKKNGFEVLPDIQLKKKGITGIKVRWRKT